MPPEETGEVGTWDKAPCPACKAVTHERLRGVGARGRRQPSCPWAPPMPASPRLSTQGLLLLTSLRVFLGSLGAGNAASSTSCF